MVRYFKELEEPNDQYLDLIYHNMFLKKTINIETLPLDFFLKYKKLFDKIKSIDLLFENNSQVKKLYLNPDERDEDIYFDWICFCFLNDLELTGTGLSKNGIDKIYYLKNEYSNRYEGSNFNEDFEKYFMAIYAQFNCSDNGFKSSKNSVFNFITSARVMAKCQNKINEYDEQLFNDALNYIRGYKVEIPYKPFEPIKMDLPNSWYITPYNHLYNSMGKHGHKEANLIYPYNSIVREDQVIEPYRYLKCVRETLERGYIDKVSFDNYTNLIYDFISIYPDHYYQLNDLEKTRYRIMHRRTYNPQIVKLIVGIESAQAGLYDFFYHLKKNSSNYYGDLEYV